MASQLRSMADANYSECDTINGDLMAEAADQMDALLNVMESAIKGLELLPFVTQSAVGLDAMRAAVRRARGG